MVVKNTVSECSEHAFRTTSHPDTAGLDELNSITQGDSQIPSYGGNRKFKLILNRLIFLPLIKIRYWHLNHVMRSLIQSCHL
jgi:hypothetical protein